MSIASAIIAARNKITNAYSVIKNKGGTLPVVQNLDNLSKTIGNISNTLNSGGEYLVKVIDYDGTVLKSDYLNTGATFTLPSQPTHEGLTFQGWSSSAVITNNTITVSNDNIVIGAVYTTTSGLSEFDITLTRASGLSVTLNMNGTKNWGDGTSNTETTHTYSTVGDYTITCNGSTITSSSSGGIFGQSSSTPNYYTKRIRLSNSVTSIGDYTFQYCYSLESITIPNSVTTIGASAFYECSSLKSIVIPSRVTTIGNDAFQRCYSLKTVVIPNGVTTIIGAFGYCYSLNNVVIPNSVATIDNRAFLNCKSLKGIVIPNSVTIIGSEAFAGCDSLNNIVIPNSVTTIGEYAFSGCDSLESITIPNSVTTIDEYAFNSCTSLKGIVIPNSVTIINTGVFSGCANLTDVVIPNNITAIGFDAFSHCHLLNNVVIPNGVITIDTGAFGYCYSLNNVVIPNSVATIGKRAFYYCYSLESITIPNSVTIISVWAFYNCKSLKSIIIPNSVTTISDEAFLDCKSLESITIPNSVTTINAGVFSGCTSMRLYDFSNHTMIPTIGQQCFLNINQDCKIMVPWALYNDWKEATNWATYADYIDTGTAATINFIVNPNDSTIYVRGQQIQETSIAYKGSTLPYIICNSISNTILADTQTNITEGTTVNIIADLTASNKITLSTSTIGLTVKFTVNDITFDATNEGNGNYSINVVGSGTSLSYVIKGEGYGTVKGTITTTGLNITIPITMEPVTEEPWTRPNLTSNGTIGGDSFAVTCTSPRFAERAWLAVDKEIGGRSTEWFARMEENPEYIFYNPDPIKVSELKFVFEYRMARTIEVYASEDRTTWESLNINYNPTPERDETTRLRYTTCTLANDNFYSYYKIAFMDGRGIVTIVDLEITATRLI